MNTQQKNLSSSEINHQQGSAQIRLAPVPTFKQVRNFLLYSPRETNWTLLETAKLPVLDVMIRPQAHQTTGATDIALAL